MAYGPSKKMKSMSTKKPTVKKPKKKTLLG